jgi:hypothetical protein
MILTNSGYIKEVYEQTGIFEISGDLSISANSIFEFGISGDSGKTAIKFSGSKVFDSSNRMLGSYFNDEPIRAVLVASPSRYSFYYNDFPIILGQNRVNTGNVKYFFANAQTGETDFAYRAKGGAPSFYVSEALTFRDNTGPITGQFINNSNFVIKLFSGEIEDSTVFTVVFPTGAISGNATGNIVFTPTGTGLAGQYPVPFNLYTNFGIVNTGTILSGYQVDSSDYAVSIQGRTEINFETNEDYLVKISSRSGDFSANVFLEHISGSGIYTTLTDYSGFKTGLATGYITESGFISLVSSVSGTGQGGLYGSEVRLLTLTGNVFQWATGTVTGNITTTGTGWATGQNYTGLATGPTTYFASGNVLNGSGKYLFSGQVTGSATTAINLYPAFYHAATGAIYYNTPENAVTSDIIYINTIYHGIVYGFHHRNINELAAYLNANTGLHKVRATVSGGNTVLLSGFNGFEGNSVLLQIDPDNDGDMAVSGPYLVGGYASGYNISVTPSGAFTGGVNSYITKSGNYTASYAGLISGSGSITNQVREFTGIWNLSTGEDFAAVSFRDSSFIQGNKYYTNNPTSGLLFAMISYEANDSSITDIVRLWVSGNGASTYLDITGIA